MLQDIKDLLAKPVPVSRAASSYNFTHPEVLDHEQVLDSVQTFMKEKSGSLPPDSKQYQALVAFFYLFWSILGTVDVELKRFKLTIKSDLTVGAGTGSSASFAVTIVALLAAVRPCEAVQVQELLQEHQGQRDELERLRQVRAGVNLEVGVPVGKNHARDAVRSVAIRGTMTCS
jgi:pantoate kinase